MDQRVLALELKFELMQRQLDEIVAALSSVPNMKAAKPAIATVEDLRSHVVQATDSAMTMPIFMRFISAENLRLMKAQRAFWQNDGGQNLSKLLELFNKEP